VFHFLNRVAARELQIYVGTAGGADKVLHFGRKQSDHLAVELEFVAGTNANGYRFQLLPTDEDRFIFQEEAIWYHDRIRYSQPLTNIVGRGHQESNLQESTEPIAAHVRADLGSYRIYHFHDTSAEARVKQTGNIEDNRRLQTDAGNLAAFLYRLKTSHEEHYRSLETAVRQIAPFFAGFDLERSRLNPEVIRLEWTEKGNDSTFTAHALSDGTLRFICLATLFLQPDPPPVILIDEPELGLHPAAIALLADLLQAAATRVQVLAATQSVTLVNQLTPEEVWVVDRAEGASVFRHLKAEDMSSWLEDYALGELWEKNLLGGRP
jgi:predicted ATPase